jgi:hypothetical protein
MSTMSKTEKFIDPTYNVIRRPSDDRQPTIPGDSLEELPLIVRQGTARALALDLEVPSPDEHSLEVRAALEPEPDPLRRFTLSAASSQAPGPGIPPCEIRHPPAELQDLEDALNLRQDGRLPDLDPRPASCAS